MAVLPTGIGPVTGYNIERSLRFNSADSAYLSRTPASAGNRKTWTWSGWIKRCATGTTHYFFSGGTGTSDTTAMGIRFTSDDTFRLTSYTTDYRVSSSVYRDLSAWYHVVVAFDTTQATASNRIKIYINGSQVTTFSTSNDPTLNADYGINQAQSHSIGRWNQAANNYTNGYMTEINFIDGQALTPSSFGETDSNTGVWKPKAFSGTYGTNGFYLNFSDNSGTTSTTLGKDSSGNGNNWTPNNFSVTAGAGNDSLVDSPTSYGTDTGVGGEVRGNYATFVWQVVLGSNNQRN
jgi:3D (Asp-Asp-Asp) domain-containing protein